MTDVAQLTFASPLGSVTVRADDTAVVRIKLDVDDHAAGDASGSGTARALCTRARDQLQAYFRGELTTFDLPLRPGGTTFQQGVWQVMSAIPYGDTLSYGEVAKQLANPGASRAVGLACGANPIPVVIPCHRITGSGGTLGGFGYGPAFKRWLLDLEHYGRPPLGTAG